MDEPRANTTGYHTWTKEPRTEETNRGDDDAFCADDRRERGWRPRHGRRRRRVVEAIIAARPVPAIARVSARERAHRQRARVRPRDDRVERCEREIRRTRGRRAGDGWGGRIPRAQDVGVHRDVERGQHRAADGRREGVARARARPRHRRRRRAGGFVPALQAQPLAEGRRRGAVGEEGRLERESGGCGFDSTIARLRGQDARRRVADGDEEQDDALLRRRRGRRRWRRRRGSPRAHRRRRRRRRGLLLLRQGCGGDEGSRSLVRPRQSRVGAGIRHRADGGAAADASRRPRASRRRRPHHRDTSRVPSHGDPRRDRREQGRADGEDRVRARPREHGVRGDAPVGARGGEARPREKRIAREDLRRVLGWKPRASARGGRRLAGRSRRGGYGGRGRGGRGFDPHRERRARVGRHRSVAEDAVDDGEVGAGPRDSEQRIRLIRRDAHSHRPAALPQGWRFPAGGWRDGHGVAGGEAREGGHREAAERVGEGAQLRQGGREGERGRPRRREKAPVAPLREDARAGGAPGVHRPRVRVRGPELPDRPGRGRAWRVGRDVETEQRRALRVNRRRRRGPRRQERQEKSRRGRVPGDVAER